MRTAERAYRPDQRLRAEREAVERANVFIREGAYLDGLRSLRADNFGAKARVALDRLQAGLRQIFVSHKVTVAAARGLAWPSDRIVSMSSPSPQIPDDAEPLLKWLQEVAPTDAEVAPDKGPVDALRDMAADAARRGNARWAARLFEESLKKLVPARRVRQNAQLCCATPLPIGGKPEMEAGVGADPARIRKLMANGDYVPAIALATQQFKATGNVARLADVHAALSEVASSGQVLSDAVVRLGRHEADVLPLGLCREAGCGEEGRAWLQWLMRALPARARSDPEPVDALLACARARLGAGSNFNAVTAALPRSPAGAWRSRLIEAEAARAAGEDRWAARLLGEVSRGAPHVTSAHRRLGQMAYKERRGREAAGHFERAMLSPNSGEQLADYAQTTPWRMIALQDGRDLYCLGEKLFVVRRDKGIVGITLFAGKPYVICNTLGYRQYRRLASILRLIRFRGPPPARQWRLSRTPETSARGNDLLDRIIAAVGRRTPQFIRWRLSPSAHRLRLWLQGPLHDAELKAMQRCLAFGTSLLRLAKLGALRFWIRAERVQFLDAAEDRVGSIFRRPAAS